jgi:hypothetical protein
MNLEGNLQRSAFGRREIVVAIVAIGLLLAFLLPFLSRQKAVARQVLCEQRQIEVAMAILRFEAARERFPGYRELAAIDETGEPQPASWVFPVLPYIQYDDEKQAFGPHAKLYDDHGPEAPDERRGRIVPKYLPDLVCPEHSPPDSDKTPSWMSFVVNCGMPDAPPNERPAGDPPDWPANGLFFDLFDGAMIPPESSTISLSWLQERDGAGQTIMLSENVDGPDWILPSERRVGFLWSSREGEILPINRDRLRGDDSLRFARPSSLHLGGVNAAMADGATRFISELIDQRVWQQMMASDDAQAKYPGTKELVWPETAHLPIVSEP